MRIELSPSRYFLAYSNSLNYGELKLFNIIKDSKLKNLNQKISK